MTAVRPARDLAATRDKLTAALAARVWFRDGEGHKGFITLTPGETVDALLPVVAEAIADELDAAADDLTRPRKGLRGVLDIASHADLERAGYARWLRARAADIREKAGRP